MHSWGARCARILSPQRHCEPRSEAHLLRRWPVAAAAAEEPPQGVADEAVPAAPIRLHDLPSAVLRCREGWGTLGSKRGSRLVSPGLVSSLLAFRSLAAILQGVHWARRSPWALTGERQLRLAHPAPSQASRKSWASAIADFSSPAGSAALCSSHSGCSLLCKPSLKLLWV